MADVGPKSGNLLCDRFWPPSAAFPPTAPWLATLVSRSTLRGFEAARRRRGESGGRVDRRPREPDPGTLTWPTTYRDGLLYFTIAVDQDDIFSDPSWLASEIYEQLTTLADKMGVLAPSESEVEAKVTAQVAALEGAWRSDLLYGVSGLESGPTYVGADTRLVAIDVTWQPGGAISTLQLEGQIIVEVQVSPFRTPMGSHPYDPGGSSGTAHSAGALDGGSWSHPTDDDGSNSGLGEDGGGAIDSGGGSQGSGDSDDRGSDDAQIESPWISDPDDPNPDGPEEDDPDRDEIWGGCLPWWLLVEEAYMAYASPESLAIRQYSAAGHSAAGLLPLYGR